MTPSGIEPATFRFVAQHLNHCATAVPYWRHIIYYAKKKSCLAYVSFMQTTHRSKVLLFVIEHHVWKVCDGVGTDLHAFLTLTINGQIHAPANSRGPLYTLSKRPCGQHGRYESSRYCSLALFDSGYSSYRATRNRHYHYVRDMIILSFSTVWYVIATWSAEKVVNLENIKVKVKWSRYRPGVAQRVGTGIALLFHDRGTRRRWAVSSTRRPHFTPGKDPVPIVQRGSVVPRAGLEGRKISSPPGFDPGPSIP